MHTLKMLVIFASFVCSAASAQSLALYRGAQRINGAQEMPDPPDPTPFRHHISVAPGDTFQAKVIFTDASGTQVDLTGTQRLLFQPLGCITATPGGLISIPAAGDPLKDCQNLMQDYPSMGIYALDGRGQILIGNNYAFRVRSSGGTVLQVPLPPGIPTPPPPQTE